MFQHRTGIGVLFYWKHGVSFEMKSAEIAVERFEVTLALPVFVQAKKNGNGEDNPQLSTSRQDFLQQWVDEITRASKWTDIKGEYPRRTGADREPSYSEFCYFHPFVRNFLYVTRDDIREHHRRNPSLPLDELLTQARNRNLRILQRDDLAWLDVDVKDLTARFAIKSCWLYLFDTQVAMLEFQLQFDSLSRKQTPASLMLEDVMTIQDSIRRTYSSYWSVFDSSEKPGTVVHNDSHVPARLTLSRKDGFQGTTDDNWTQIESSFGNFETEGTNCEDVRAHADYLRDDVEARHSQSVKSHLDHVARHREPFTVEVWQKLLYPLVPTTLDLEDAKGRVGDETPVNPLRFEHIQDERAMLYSYIGIGGGNVRNITEGDWLRLASVDDPGDSNRYPYSPDFFADAKNSLSGFVYDRFWHPTGVRPAQPYQTTRWLCSGYGFTGVGDANDKDFFTDEHAGALCHFRHHYFALSLIAQFHRASLLMYKHRLAEAADCMLSNDAKFGEGDWARRLREIDFRAKAEELAKEIMRFRTLYWFSEVSNQVQGQELFAMFRKHLNLRELFGEVTADSEAAVSLLRQWDAEDGARATASLGVLAAFLVCVGPFLSNLNSLFKIQWYSTLGIALILASLVFFFQRFPTHWLRNDYSSRWKLWRAKLCRWTGLHPKLKLLLCSLVLLIGVVLMRGSMIPN